MNKNLPIKIVLPRKDDIKPIHGRGGPKKFFGDYNLEVQNKIINCFNDIGDYYAPFFKETKNLIPAVAMLIMKEEACAKSHTPESLLKNNHIFGSKDINQFYIQVSESSLAESIEIASNADNDTIKANMTAIENIVPVLADDKLSDFLKDISDIDFEKIKKSIKLKLYDYDDDALNEKSKRYVFQKLQEFNLLDNLQPVIHEKSKLYKLELKSKDELKKISNIVGIQTIDIFHTYVLPSFLVDEIDMEKLNNSAYIDSDTTIGIIDGGIGDKNSALNQYIVDRRSYVGADYQNHQHGAFIASTILYGNYLNKISETKPKRFKLLDIEALPNNDPTVGYTDSISEDDLMDIIEECMKQYSGIVKIWNLSIGLPDCVCNGEISDFGEFLDIMQDKYNVQFFVSSGNFLRLEKWPFAYREDDSDRIIAPADSVRAITVGSLALNDSEESYSKINEPSCFTRRGPGVGYMVKPEIVDYGGNYNITGNSKNVGIFGMTPDNKLVENIGTSFATPRALYKYSYIYDELVEKDLLLAKALLIHSARINSKSLLKEGQRLYTGYGMAPNDPQDILQTSSDEITIVFKQGIKQGKILEMLDFPFPKSLIYEGKYHGEIFMTLVYSPLLDKNYGVNYCRSNVDVSFGPVYSNKTYNSKVKLEKVNEYAFEKERVKNGSKWAPVKAYYHNLKQGIQVGNYWKLEINRLTRYDVALPEQEFILVITIRDPNGKDIYSDMVNELREKSFVTNNLEVRSQVRQRQ